MPTFSRTATAKARRFNRTLFEQKLLEEIKKNVAKKSGSFLSDTLNIQSRGGKSTVKKLVRDIKHNVRVGMMLAFRMANNELLDLTSPQNGSQLTINIFDKLDAPGGKTIGFGFGRTNSATPGGGGPASFATTAGYFYKKSHPFAVWDALSEQTVQRKSYRSSRAGDRGGKRQPGYRRAGKPTKFFFDRGSLKKGAPFGNSAPLLKALGGNYSGVNVLVDRKAKNLKGPQKFGVLLGHIEVDPFPGLNGAELQRILRGDYSKRALEKRIFSKDVARKLTNAPDAPFRPLVQPVLNFILTRVIPLRVAASLSRYNKKSGIKAL